MKNMKWKQQINLKKILEKRQLVMVRNEMKKNCNTAKKMYNKIIKKRNGEKKNRNN